MKALSVRQPWADLILVGAKDVENRTWWTSYRGRLAIHAAKTWTADAAALYLDAKEKGYLPDDQDGCKLGFVLGTVELVGVVRRVYRRDEELPWAWELANPVQFEHPFLWPGRYTSRLFDVPDDAIDFATMRSDAQAIIDAVCPAASSRQYVVDAAAGTDGEVVAATPEDWEPWMDEAIERANEASEVAAEAREGEEDAEPRFD